jgi:hypothetical protein
MGIEFERSWVINYDCILAPAKRDWSKQCSAELHVRETTEGRNQHKHAVSALFAAGYSLSEPNDGSASFGPAGSLRPAIV